MVTEKEVLAYLGGYFDGEGCITLSKPSKHKRLPQLTISVASGDKAIIEFFETIFGGKAKKTTNMRNSRRQIYRWCAYSSNAQRILQQLLPYLFAKRIPADLALMCDFSQHGGEKGISSRGLRIDESEEILRNWAQEELHRYNNRITITNFDDCPWYG